MQELLSPLLAAPGVTVVAMLAVILLATIGIGFMPRVTTLALGRLAPHWVNKATILLQTAVIIGEVAFISRFFATGWPVATAALLVLALVAAVLFFGAVSKDRLAGLRVRFQPGAPVSPPNGPAALSTSPTRSAPPLSPTAVAPPRVWSVAPLTRRPALGNLSTSRLIRK